jgi:ApbE family
MGVDVVVGEASIEEFVAVTQLFDVWERTFSRFRPESELNRINGNASSMVLATPLFARVLRTALVAASATAGLVDPTLAVALEAAGYDRDFTLLDDDPRPLGASAIGSWRSIRLEGRLLFRPPGCAPRPQRRRKGPRGG